MCTMMIDGKVCKSKPVKIARDKTLDGLSQFIREKCATAKGKLEYLKSIGLVVSPDGTFDVVPM